MYNHCSDPYFACPMGWIVWRIEISRTERDGKAYSICKVTLEIQTL